MDLNPDPEQRMPLPSEDTGDLVDEPEAGQTDDYLVAQEEGVPYTPPTDRVLSETRLDESGPDVAGTAENAGEQLARDDAIQAEGSALDELPVDGALEADVAAALRDSEMAADEQLTISARGHTVTVSGRVESVTVADELLGVVSEVPGVDDVVDALDVSGE